VERKKTPWWLLGMFDPSCFYSSMDEIVDELTLIDSGKKPMDNKYWKLLKSEYR